MKKPLKFTCLAFLPLLFASNCAVQEPQFQLTYASTRRALLRGEIKEALAFYESQAREAEKNAEASRFSGQHWENATAAYTEAARAAWLTGQLQKAITYGEKALATAEKTKSPSRWLGAAEQLIISYTRLRSSDKARVLIEKGFQIVREIPPNSYGRVVWEANLYQKLGSDLLLRREYQKAVDAYSNSVYLTRVRLSFLTRASQTSLELENTRTTTIERLNFLGNAYRQAGNFEQALEQYESALNAIRDWRLKFAYEGRLYQNIGQLYLLRKDFSQALDNFQKAFLLGESQGRPIASPSSQIGNVLMQLGKHGDATPYYQKAIQEIESTRSLLQSEEYRHSFFEGGLNVYVSIVGALLDSNKPEEAFNYSERARSRIFLDVLGSRVQLSRARSGLLGDERALQERIAAIRARLSSEEALGPAGTGLRKELEAAQKAYAAFLSKVRKQDKEQASLMSVEPLSLKQVRELLDSGTTLIEYFVTERETFVWVVEKERLHFQRVPIAKEELARSVRTLRETIFTLGEKEKFDEISTSLHKHLIEPVLPHINGKELIIVPHDVLHYLPFHALQSPDGKYLIEKYPIYYLSSASLLQFVKEKRKAMGEKVLALGNPDVGDPEKDLQFAEAEANEIQRLYPQSTVLLRKEATKERGKTLSPQHDILHFATHAQLNEDDPLSSAVLLAKGDKEDGRLEVREIFGMDLKANLVVLSGCETGLGKLSTGDELVGLTRAFIYAGTPSVVASLWKVDDGSTAQLMASFYRNLKTMTKVEALRQAQLAMIRGDGRSGLLARRGVGGIGKLGETPSSEPRPPSSLLHASGSVSTSHPYFWAPFILVGDGK